MSAELVHAEEWDDLLQEMLRLLRALDAHKPAELGRLLVSRGLEDDARRAVEALAVLQVAGKQRHPAIELLQLLGPGVLGREADAPDLSIGGAHFQVKHVGAARKVSVSMPEDLTTAVQHRVGRGKFSQYVTEAVTRQLELDLLAELSDLLTSEHGPIPEKYLAEAQAAWPDDE
jgi:Arc/MetJ-type ribon-helix-helix transcriptional regulator